MKPPLPRAAATRIAAPTAALIAALIGAAPATAAHWTAIERLPDAAPMQLLVNDKPRVYFTLTSDKPLVVPVEGPVRLRLTTRALLPAGSKGVVTYQVKATDGKRVLDQLSTETSASAEARPQGGSQAVGKSRKLTFDVASGTRRVTLELSGASTILVRVQLATDAANETQMVSLTPVSASRSVSVSEGEKIIPYYTARAGQPVRVRVVGPTTLELLTRLDFDATMRGTIRYRLRVVENDRVLRELDFKTTKATTAVYTNLSDRIPSKFDRVSLPILGGPHEIAIELIQPTGAAAEIHARIPQPSVGNEE